MLCCLKILYASIIEFYENKIVFDLSLSRTTIFFFFCLTVEARSGRSSN